MEEELTFDVQRQCEQVGVAEALADLRCSSGGRDRTVDVTLRFMLKRDRDQQVALLGAVPALAVDDPLRAADPAAGRPELAT